MESKEETKQANASKWHKGMIDNEIIPAIRSLIWMRSEQAPELLHVGVEIPPLLHIVVNTNNPESSSQDLLRLQAEVVHCWLLFHRLLVSCCKAKRFAEEIWCGVEEI